MNQQEQQLISDLAERLRNAPAPNIDRDADELIRRTIGIRPDALYVLTQTVLIQDMALSQAKARIQQLEQAAQQPGFLPEQPGYSQSGPAQGGYAQSGYAQSPYAGQAYPPAGYEEPHRGGLSSFLHSAATTAAGVLAGEIAFDSLASIFGGGRGGFLGGGGYMPGGETIVNNYYETGGRPMVDTGGESRFAQFADADQDVSPDIDDDRGFSDDSGGFDGGDSGDSF